MQLVHNMFNHLEQMEEKDIILDALKMLSMHFLLCKKHSYTLSYVEKILLGENIKLCYIQTIPILELISYVHF